MLRIRQVRKEKKFTQQAVADILRVTQATFSGWETGKYEIDNSNLIKLAELFNVSIDYLMGRTSSPENTLPSPVITNAFTTYPVIGEVAAGYDNIAVEDWEGEIIEIPDSYLQGHQKNDFFVLRVKGESMYPIYQEGDKVLVLKQITMDYSGQVGVVIYDDEKATLKKVEYAAGEDWMRFVPINPSYPVVKIENEELEHCRIIGIPRLLIREITE